MDEFTQGSSATGAGPERIETGDRADYVVLLLDFLGHKQHLERWKELADKARLGNRGGSQPADPEELTEAIRGSAGVVANHYVNLRHYLLEKHIYQRLAPPTDFRLKSVQYSDTIVFYAKIEALEQPGALGLFVIAHAMLVAIDALFISVMETQAPVRGAIAIGQAVEGVRDASAEPNGKWNCFLSGPVLSRVDELERSLCDYPRILVDSDVVRYLRKVDNLNPEWLDQNYRLWLDNALGFVPGGVDGDEDHEPGGFRVLDWAGKRFCDTCSPQDRRQNTKCLREMISRTRQFRDEAIAQHGLTGDQTQLRVAGKYARLLRYLELRLPIWADCQPVADP